MKYLKKFDTHSDYETFKQSAEYIEPNVSVCVNEDEVHFNPIVIDPHKYVDLGLPSGTLWATENIKDANGNELYFAWGETQGYRADQITNNGSGKEFSINDYKYYEFGDVSKYNSTDGKTILDSEDDAATANWGSGWRMPTKEQFDELTANTTTAWTQVDGVSGLLFTSTANTNTLFFPAADGSSDDDLVFFGYNGFYWSASLGDDYWMAFCCNFTNWSYYVDEWQRQYGYSVRPVRASN